MDSVGMEEIKLKYLADNLRIKSLSDTPQTRSINDDLIEWLIWSDYYFYRYYFLRLSMIMINQRFFSPPKILVVSCSLECVWAVSVRCVMLLRAPRLDINSQREGSRQSSGPMIGQETVSCTVWTWQDNYHPDSTQTWKIREFCFKCQDQVGGWPSRVGALARTWRGAQLRTEVL